MLDGDTCRPLWILGDSTAGPPLEMIRDQGFSPCGTYLAIAHGKLNSPEVTVLAAETGQQVWRLSERVNKDMPGQMILALAFSPDGTRIAVGGAGQEVPEQEVALERAIAEDEDDVMTDANVYVYKVENGSVESKHAHGLRLRSLCWSPDSSVLALGGDGVKGVALVDPAESGSTVLRLKAYKQVCFSLTFSNDGTQLACGFNNDEGPKGGGLLHIAIAGLKHKQSAFTVADVHRIIEANPVACLAAIGSMDEPIDEPQTPLHQAIERGWQSIFSKMFEVLATVNPNSTTLPPYSHKMLQIQRAGIQSTAQLLIEEYPRYQSVAVLCLSLLMSDPPGCLRGIPKGAHDYALTVKDKAALTDETWEELVDEDPRDAQFQLEPLTTYKPPESNPFEVSVEAAKCRPHILEKDLWAGSEYKLRVITFPSRGLQDAIMASREAALVFHPLFTSTVRAKWIFFGQKYAFVEVILMAFFLCSFIAWGSLAHGCPPSHPTEEQDVSQERTYLICTTTNTDELSHLISLYVMWWTITLLMCGFYAFKELREGVSLAYFTDAFNIIDMFNLLLTVALLITDAASRFPAFSANDIDAATAQAEWPVVYLLSLSLLLHFVRLIDKYRAFKIFGTYIRALLQIFADMFGFIFLLLTLNAAFAIVFYWLFNADAADEDRGHPGGLDLEMSFLKSFTVGVLGEFGFDDLAGFPRFLVVIVIILWVVINIVMLNSLIALVSESWANITGERELNSRIERGTILNNIEAFWYRKAAPQFLFVAERGEPELLAEETQGESPEESEGLVGTMQRDTLKALIEEILAPLKSEISSLQKNRTVWGSPGPGGEGGGAPASSI
uniref:Ion transport domain-containing protein n=1 Tax=Chromera velia CCMP2878 TaxID=1169474 RepID=A0A0G4GIX8_9ALVE|eukprot:Cvel_22099.t1-p1 / transcript=Cvel_22099.t1 / gene=Cvel_22099 / organism=Chromera_velia_CCMP2878 / gene_product=WD repeat-containing protein 61 homolog, putative / transcript_product=WD repeat-containing protein 61 homolog, putative / location=Cvel_scaffold2139:17541-22133(-) / protein_length=840 / sequence_SO=supercontig / SO=protein_coding / is_pseudo=false